LVGGGDGLRRRHGGTGFEKCRFAARGLGVLVVIEDGLSLDGVNGADEEAIVVEVRGAGHEIFGPKSGWCRHMQDVKRAARKSKWMAATDFETANFSLMKR
jgi:hypothetical protein